ncbi:ATP-grasp domain-containing protein [Hymenobacter sp. 15J16-1T3B]|uniref:ATP-grasp domain-containing protein n=1 Tax=Hymenobacter sp. 15J16-1T3B TaxID=2886941 RepID=UPI001D109953|nr:ATP-grasp domain-containing protein [Hymenobacter sp. 15J16-1T3B]MCC3157183.1 ATP-grasp domain-containing protein [Hymenobacter sp. 15J16-1T3B]
MHELKKFTGVLVRRPGDLVGCGEQGRDTAVWCAEPLRFVAEWRCFVRYGRTLDVRLYRGDWAQAPDRPTVERAVAAYATAPHGYALDFGLTDAGATVVVEANEGYAIGAYGLAPVPYAKLLAARWAQLTGTPDYCAF